MLSTYLPGDTAHLLFEFTDVDRHTVQADSDVIVNVGEEGRTSVLLKD